MSQLFTNNASSVLVEDLLSSATSINLGPGEGEQFPLPDSGDPTSYAILTLEDVNGNFEIVKLTERTGDLLTIERAQENTIAAGFATGSRVECRLTAGALLFLISFVMNDYFLPLGNIRLGSMYRKILYTNPGIELEPYSVKRYQDTVIVTGEIQENVIRNITIIDKTEDKEKRVITAQTGKLQESGNQKGVISIRLEEVFSHVSDASAAG